MESISLIIPISETNVPTGTEIASYRRVLRDQAHASSVEVILAGDFSAAAQRLGRAIRSSFLRQARGKLLRSARG